MKKLFCMVMLLLFLLGMVGCCVMTDSEVQTPEVSSSNSNLDNETSPDVQKNIATIEESVILDEAGIKITAKSLEIGGLFGEELKLLIENTSGVDVTVQVNNFSVNGYMIDPIMSADVVNGKKANTSLTITNSELEMCGIETIADMEFNFHIFRTDNWDTYLDSDLIKITTSAAEEYEYTYDDSGEIAYNANGVKIVVKGLSENDSILGPGIIVYIHNESNQNITVQTRDVSINGFMVDGMFSSDVAIGKHCIDSITFLSSDLEENGIEKIESTELAFHIFNSESWRTIADSDVILIEF